MSAAAPMRTQYKQIPSGYVRSWSVHGYKSELTLLYSTPYIAHDMRFPLLIFPARVQSLDRLSEGQETVLY